MQMQATVLAGRSETLPLRKGGELPKTRLKVMDIGAEANGGDVYWIDFLGECALSEEELGRVHRQQATLEVRRMYASAGKTAGKAYLNAAGGAVTLNGQIIQRGLRTPQTKSA
jgi:hypothetical protein